MRSHHQRLLTTPIGRSPQSAQRPTNARQRERVEKPGWNQPALEITWLCLQPEDSAREWTLVVHRLREASPFIDKENCHSTSSTLALSSTAQRLRITSRL
ncbi:MAG TPA: RNaseH domain-containing protein [Coleofasciculaceae cyanobacterium]